MLDNARTIIDINVHMCMLTDSPTLYYRGSRGEKIFSCAVDKFGPDVIPDSVSSASHTVTMEQYLTLIQCYSGLIFSFLVCTTVLLVQQQQQRQILLP